MGASNRMNMETNWLNLLACPLCQQAALRLQEIERERDGRIREGILVCRGCGEPFPVLEGIPRLVPADLRSPEANAFLAAQSGRLGEPERSLPTTRGVSIPSREAALDALAEMQVRDRLAPTYDADIAWKADPGGLRRVLERLDMAADSLTLDAGCGTGRLLPSLLKRCDRVVGCDLSVESMRLFQHRHPEYARRVLLVQADLTRLPFASERADRVVSLEVLQHIPSLQSQKTALAEVRRVLRSQRRFVVSAYHDHPFWRLYWRIVRGYGKEGYLRCGSFGYRFGPREFSNLLGTQFTVRDLRTASLGRLLVATCTAA